MCVDTLQCPCFRTHEHKEYPVGAMYSAGCEDWCVLTKSVHPLQESTVHIVIKAECILNSFTILKHFL